MSLEILNKLVEDGEAEESEAMARKLLAEGTDPLRMIETLTKTMNRLGDLFAKLEIFLPEMMLAGEALAAVVKVLAPYLASAGGREIKGKVVLGVVKGDLHEIGKNIVKLILETNGFEIEDLGYDVDPLNFIKAAETVGADYIGVSSLMTTTMPGQKEIIELLKEKGLRDKHRVVIGGAPTSQLWADKIGADLYCQHAKSAPELMNDLLKNSRRRNPGKEVNK
jgi:corrinoid protein of di/trimethylamine methyltransferase